MIYDLILEGSWVKWRGAAHISESRAQEPVCIGQKKNRIDLHSGRALRLESFPKETIASC
jgi:hypothetical protein